MKLYGFTRSNYYNTVKMALLEKGASFEEVEVMPNQEEDFLAKSPMGKVPVLETEHGFLSETSAILDYIEEAVDGPSFYPDDPWQRAKVRELMSEVELYLDLAVRPCIPAAFFGAPENEQTLKRSRKSLEKGIAALRRTAKFSPYIAGDQFTYADMLAAYCLPLADQIAKKFWPDLDLVDALGAGPMMEAVAQRESSKTIAGG